MFGAILPSAFALWEGNLNYALLNVYLGTPARRFGFKSNSKFQWTNSFGAEDGYCTSFDDYCYYLYSLLLWVSRYFDYFPFTLIFLSPESSSHFINLRHLLPIFYHVQVSVSHPS